MGTVYKRGGVYWIKYSDRGKIYYESAKTGKVTKARELLKLREGEIAKGEAPGVSFGKYTFDDLAKNLVTDYRVNNRKTLDKVERELKLHLKPYFGGLAASSINTAKIKEYIDHRKGEGASNGTVNRELSALKRMLNLGARETPPKVNRVPHIKMLKENNTRSGFFEHNEYLELVRVLPEYLKGPVMFAYKTGWRSGEVRGLTWEVVDRDAGIVRLEAGTTKNDQARTVYLDPELKELMNEQFRKRRLGCPYVFHQGGCMIGPDFRGTWRVACAMVAKALKKPEVKGRLFHDLRRTAVRNMVRAGIPERVAMQISGHKTRSVFDRYNIVSGDDLKEAAKKLQAHLSAEG